MPVLVGQDHKRQEAERRRCPRRGQLQKKKAEETVSNESGAPDRIKGVPLGPTMALSETGPTSSPMSSASSSDNLAAVWRLYGQYEPTSSAVVIFDTDSDWNTEGGASSGDAVAEGGASSGGAVVIASKTKGRGVSTSC